MHSAICWRLRPDAIPPEQWLDLLAGAGLFAAMLVTSGVPFQLPLFALCWLLYMQILLVGQTFLSFQWDIFLLEVGGLALLYAPAWRGTSPREPCAVAVLLMGWCLFKIMIMSGVVKVQARCPTWMGLTALHYHYATQCIPTPLSWYVCDRIGTAGKIFWHIADLMQGRYAHQLPCFIQKLSVMGTLLIEIPGAFLIIAPWREARVWAAWLNIFLMIAIVLTGNYTFFNLLTAALCLPLLEEREMMSAGREGGARVKESPEKSGQVRAAPDGCSFESETLRRRTGELARELHNEGSLLHSDQHTQHVSAARASRNPDAFPPSRTAPPREPGMGGWLLASLKWCSPLAYLLAAATVLFHYSVRPQGAGGDEWCPLEKGGTPGGGFQATVACMWHVLEYKLDVKVSFSVEEMDQYVHLAILWASPIFFFQVGSRSSFPPSSSSSSSSSYVLS